MSLRKWQQNAFDFVKDEKYSIVNALTGSGKSYLMNHIAIYRYQTYGEKTIIAVPQEVIRGSFSEDDTPHLTTSGKVIVKNFIVDTFLEAYKKSEKLKIFLQNTSTDFICVVSYRTLLNLYCSDSKCLIDNSSVSLFIDEAHHIQEDPTYSNGLGKMIGSLIDNGQTKILLSSATFFRGDKLSILSEKNNKLFCRYELPVEEYMKDLKHLKDFKIDVQLYDIASPQKYISENRELLLSKKSIIYLPNVSSIEATTIGSKAEWVNIILSSLANGEQIIGPTEDGIYTIANKKILDLVTLSHRKKSKIYLVNNQKNFNAIDVIITLGLMKEGANYVHAENAYVFGNRESLNELVQILGRVLRDSVDKASASMTLLTAKTIYTTDTGYKESVDNYVKAVLASMVIGEAMYPVGENKKEISRNTHDENKLTPWEEISATNRQSLLYKSIAAALTLSRESMLSEYYSVIEKVVIDSGLIENRNVNIIVNKIIDINLRRNALSESVDLSGVNFNAITCPFEWLFSTKEFGIDNFTKLRKALSTIISYDELKKLVIERKIKTSTEYDAMYKEITGAPARPHIFYSDKWISWNNFLNTEFVDYLEFKEKVRLSGIKTISEYKKNYHVLGRVPKLPNFYYEEWESWPKLFERDRLIRKSDDFIEYEKLKAAVVSINITTKDEYAKQYKSIPGAPSDPRKSYADWEGWNIFLGTGKARQSSKKFLPYQELKNKIQSLGIKSTSEYKSKYKQIEGAPGSPDGYYKEWEGWVKFCGKVSYYK